MVPLLVCRLDARDQIHGEVVLPDLQTASAMPVVIYVCIKIVLIFLHLLSRDSRVAAMFIAFGWGF